MKLVKSLLGAIALVGIVAVAPAGNYGKKSNTIVDVASANGNFTTLLAALDAADLTDTLKGDGPYTVFAPTDAAFAALPEGTVEALLADPQALANILTFHVAAGKTTAETVVTLDSVTTLQGGSLDVSTANGVMIGKANVVAADVMADNGVIHVIDAVLLP
ncbi:MAG: beta-Ig-H3/fasciclin [Lysobacteraceae bacterium]|nr:MAG: beta-Ig-H3/fasciclin [Xanthomonadaceae bacterium]